jgi:arginine decarboxylase
MSTIRVVSGTGTGPTALAAYDAALADAGVHNYNLVRVSSVIPDGSRIEESEAAPDLGPAGNRLTVVEARATTEIEGDDPETHVGASAGLGWTREESGRGLFYEASGSDPEAVRDRVTEGLAAGRDLREWSFVDERVVTADTATDLDPHCSDAYATAVVVGAYGESEPIL